MVVDVPTPYKGIMGRPWLHDVEGVASTYHHKVKYLVLGRVKIIRGNQKEFREYMNTLIRGK